MQGAGWVGGGRGKTWGNVYSVKLGKGCDVNGGDETVEIYAYLFPLVPREYVFTEGLSQGAGGRQDERHQCECRAPAERCQPWRTAVPLVSGAAAMSSG